MPVICDTIPIATKLSENLNLGFKKNEKENYDTHPTPTVKQVLSAKIEYEEVPNNVNATIGALQAKYILLEPNQQPLTLTTTNVHANSKILHNENGNDSSNFCERSVNCVNGSSTSSSSSSSQVTKLPQPKRVLFSKDRIQIGWNNNNGIIKGSGCGLTNIGNTCYLNSALQAFFHVPALAQWLVSDKEHREKSNCKDNAMCIICAMAHTLITTHQKISNNSFVPSYITNRLSQICKHLTLGRQEDAHEFLRYLVEKMEKAYLFRFRSEPWYKDLDQYSKETTPLNQILGGYLRSTVTCLSCNYESVTFQHFQDLALDISRVGTLSEAISGYFSRENLEECGYKCESCKKRVSAAKRFTLERLPVVLCIQLKRFTAMGGKMSKHIQISEKLSLQKYLSKHSDPHQDSSYKFVSMVTHLGGSASGGHYTAVGMSPGGNFYHFDDSRVSPISLEGALRGNAYVLFYELVQDSKKFTNNSQNGHSNIYIENGHNYIKNRNDQSTNGPSSSSSSSLSSISRSNTTNHVKPSEASFSVPSLPKMFIPSNVIKQQQQMKTQQQPNNNIDRSPSPKNGIKSNTWSLNGKISPGIVKLNGSNKRELSESDNESKSLETKKIKSSQLPSVPRLLDDDEDVKSPQKQQLSSFSKVNLITSSKPKSLVPAYETDDDDDDENKKDSQATICHTTSGIFIETDFKENGKFPSKQGSTIVTKASLTTSKSDSHINGKILNNNNAIGITRSDDAVSQLTKLNHSGYGTNNVQSWNNTPTNMNKEVIRDQQEDRKRQYEDEGDIEMDRGKTKKLKYNSGQNLKMKLPNPFNQQQNIINQNGFERHNNDRMTHYND
ncbi:hypothetical protein PVAND_010088 [Polypedilum vanderplanki]|uniref:Ubiquitin carboxyl-terminal hydrolase 36 n=1 Tax=Polypedilum vanderplanki TaxID=319348 RepID=A0A9J6CFL0_POLVA|nr:hypothetical protein PVAND_010088 [Polypedilum vanderplanki]